MIPMGICYKGADGLRERARQFLDMLSSAIRDSDIDRELPRMVCDIEEDRTYFEWIFPSFTLGFNISDGEAGVEWFLISDEFLGDIDAVGSNLTMDDLHMILNFIDRYGNC